MRRTTTLIFLIVTFLSPSYFALADLEINEIMYSPTSKQWVEIYNDSSDTIDLTKYKILDAGASVNGHGISLCSGSLSPQSYAIIAKVPEDFSNVTFTLCKSALGIKSTTDDTVILKLDSNEVDTVLVAEGSATGGNSLQFFNGSWISATPTPGALNQEATVTETNDESNNTNDQDADTGGDENTSTSSSGTSSSKSSSSSSSQKIVEPQTKVKILASKVAFIGLPFELYGEVSRTGGEKLNSGKYFWNFGDGNSAETNDLKKFPYTYFYEGEYVISLEYYSKNSSQAPDATAETTVKVVLADVSISKIGNQDDFFIELSNNTNYEIDISGWILLSLNRIFAFPKNSSLLPKKKIKLSPKVTNFTIEDANTLKLNTASGDLVFDYSRPLAPALATIPKKSASPAVASLVSSISLPETKPNDEAEISGEDLLASSGQKGAYLPMLASVVLVFGSAAAVYFIRQKKIVKNLGDDFDILE